jgi:hypothetical protein
LDLEFKHPVRPKAIIGSKNTDLLNNAIIASPKFLEEFFARIVYIVNTKGKIAYKQVVRDIKKEPDYKDILLALKDIGSSDWIISASIKLKPDCPMMAPIKIYPTTCGILMY